MHRLLITLYAVWPLAVIFTRLLSAVRIRFLVVTALCWVTARMIGTSGSPTNEAMTGGLVVGAGCNGRTTAESRRPSWPLGWWSRRWA